MTSAQSDFHLHQSYNNKYSDFHNAVKKCKWPRKSIKKITALKPTKFTYNSSLKNKIKQQQEKQSNIQYNNKDYTISAKTHIEQYRQILQFTTQYHNQLSSTLNSLCSIPNFINTLLITQYQPLLILSKKTSTIPIIKAYCS